MFGGWLCRGSACGISAVFQDVSDGGIIGGVHIERQGTGCFEAFIPVSLTHLEDAHTRTICLFFGGLLLQRLVYDGGGASSDLLGPVGIFAAIEPVELGLIPVVRSYVL